MSGDDRPIIDASHLEAERLRLSPVPEAVCIALAYLIAAATILPELATHSMHSWHT